MSFCCDDLPATRQHATDCKRTRSFGVSAKSVRGERARSTTACPEATARVSEAATAPRDTPRYGNNGNARRSFGFVAVRSFSENPCKQAVSAHSSERPRTPAPSRQAGGHWFEPSSAHLMNTGIAASRDGGRSRFGGRLAASWLHPASGAQVRVPRFAHGGNDADYQRA